MTEYDDLPTMAPPMERDLSGFAPATPADQMPIPYGGLTMIQQTNRETTARRVAVPRDPGKVFAQINAFSAQFGDQYVYSWPVKNNSSGTKSIVEGGTIKLANMLARAYGNCQVDCDISETASHFIFKAFFVDFETGLSTARLFQQRKSQNTGMKDADRQADIIFQIGQSKAIRNVILNALSDYAAHAVEQSKNGLLKKFASDEAREKAHDFIEQCQERFGISGIAVDAVIGRARREWTIPNLARAYMLMRGVYDGLTSASEAFPTDDVAGEIINEQATETRQVQTRANRAGKKAADKAEPKKDEAKAEPDMPPREAQEEALRAYSRAGLQEAQERAPARQQGDGAGKATEAAAKPQEPAEKHGDELLCDDFLIDLKNAASFEAIETVRAAYSKVVWPPALATKLKTATGEARARVKDAAKAKPAETAPEAEDEFDEEAALSQIEEMFSGLTKLADVETTRDSLVKVIGRLSEAGVRRATMIYNTAQNHAKAKEAEVTPEASETTMLFGDD